MRGRDAQLTFILVRELLTESFDVLCIEEDALDYTDKFLPRLRQAQEPLTLALKQFDAEFVLKILDVLGDAGLGREKRIGHFGQVEVLSYGLADDTKLLEIHLSPILHELSPNTLRRLQLMRTILPVASLSSEICAGVNSTSK